MSKETLPADAGARLELRSRSLRVIWVVETLDETWRATEWVGATRERAREQAQEWRGDTSFPVRVVKYVPNEIDRSATLPTDGRQEAMTAYWREQLDLMPAMDAQAELERLRASLLDLARRCERLKRPCGMDPESAQAVRNGEYMSISLAARAALGA